MWEEYGRKCLKYWPTFSWRDRRKPLINLQFSVCSSTPNLKVSKFLPISVDPNIHQVGKYARKCEAEALKIKLTIENLLSEGIIPVGLRIPVCQYDGRYSRLMVNNTQWVTVTLASWNLKFSYVSRVTAYVWGRVRK